MASPWQSFIGVLTPGHSLAGRGAVNPNHMVGGTQPHEHLQDCAPVVGCPNPREVQMELKEDPTVRAGAASDDEEEEEFQDSREDQFDQIP